MGNSVRKNVLYIGGFELPDKNAAAHRVMANAMLLRELGFEVSLIGVTKESEIEDSTFNGFCCRCLKYPKNIKEWLYHIINYIPLKSIELYSPQYIFLYNFPAIASLRILHYCRKHNIKVIHDLTEWEQTTIRTPRDIIKKIDTELRMHYCIKRMDGVIAISRFLYSYYQDVVNTILVPPTVDLSNHKWNRNRILTSNRPITLVYAGSPGGFEKDRLDIIIDEVVKRPNLAMNVIGLSEDQFCNSYHRSHLDYRNVIFRGRVSHDIALREVSEADFQILIRDNTLKNNAGFPTKLVESITCGTPLISTIFSNITDYIQDGENGFIIDNKQPLSDVFDKISGLDANDIIRMKRNCIEIREFDYQYYKSEFEKLFV